jgi:AraC-like DNA-binding protein
MKILHSKPSNKVAEFVQEILVIEEPNLSTPFILPLFANGMPTLLFHSAKGLIGDNSRYLTMFGQTVAPNLLTVNDNFVMIAYFLKPYALKVLYGITANELTDKPLDLSLLNQTARNLQERLLNTSSTQEMLALIDDYISKMMSAVKMDIRPLEYATEKIVANPAKQVLVATQRELCMTERTFQRLFEHNIGIAPNQYRRVVQFHTAFQQLQKRQFKHLSDIAFRNDYADQSHYIRSFREFTNLSPKEYLQYGSGD